MDGMNLAAITIVLLALKEGWDEDKDGEQVINSVGCGGLWQRAKEAPNLGSRDFPQRSENATRRETRR